jgi:deferrochelatase/peroxidase EfeB
MPPALQEGIFHAPGHRSGPSFALLFLETSPDAPAAEVGAALGGIWQMLQALKGGGVADLPGHAVPAGNLTCLIGYGINAFELSGARRALPDELAQFGRFRSPLTLGGGPLLAGSGQLYAADVRKNPATEAVVLQFIGDGTLAVDRAVVETWKVLHDRQRAGSTVLQLAAFFQGFQRDDHRSWIDFHDGVSNLPSQRREEAIVIKDVSAEGDRWTVGGTYMAFLRMAADLAVWRGLSREQQELLVGRDKLSGCPLTANGALTPAAGCPVAGTREAGETGNEAFLEPADPPEASALAMSHVQRVNHHRQDFDARDSLRIFRQGYEFLEPITEAPGFRAGLNFVSFQDTPERLLRILTQPAWLGKTNFGGDPDHPLPGMDRFLTVRAAGIFLVPPAAAGESFPGSSLFMPRPRRNRVASSTTGGARRRSTRSARPVQGE